MLFSQLKYQECSSSLAYVNTKNTLNDIPFDYPAFSFVAFRIVNLVMKVFHPATMYSVLQSSAASRQHEKAQKKRKKGRKNE